MGRLADLQVYVASEVEAVIGEVAVVAGLRILLEHTVLLLISGRDEILRVLRATPEIEGVSLSVNGLCNQIRPLRVRIKVRIGSRPVEFDEFVGILLVHSVIVGGLICKRHILPRVHKLRNPVRNGHVLLQTELNLRLGDMSPFSGDENHAVCSLCTIHCSGRGILEKAEAVDFVRVEVGDASRHTVNEH